MNRKTPAADSADANPNPFGDGLEMMRKLWGSPGAPAAATEFAAAAGLAPGMPLMMAPTFDVGEIDKRIADLRAVEQWLNLNVNLLRATIQGLEVQRNTIETLRSFGGVIGDAVGGAASKAKEPSGKAQQQGIDPGASLKPDPALWWNALQQQFTQLVGAAAQGAARPAAKRRRRTAGK
jgi:hypothetical protein